MFVIPGNKICFLFSLVSLAFSLRLLYNLSTSMAFDASKLPHKRNYVVKRRKEEQYKEVTMT